MITFKPIVIQGGRRKDGTWPVKIRVTFKGASRRLPTTLVCLDSDLTKSKRIKNANVLQKAGDLISRMRAACADLSPYTLEAWSVDDVVAHIRRALTAETWRLDFFAFADGYIVCKQPTTRKAYTAALNTFARYLGERSIDVNAITRRMLLDFVAWCDGNTRGKVAGGASAMYVAKLAHIYNAAKYQYNDEDSGTIRIPRTPFDGLRKSYPPSHGQRNVGVEVLQRIIDARPAFGTERIALAAFVVSFALCGANLADLYAARRPDGTTWKYNRRKTAARRADDAEIVVDIPECIAPFLDALECEISAFWWLPALHRWTSAQNATVLINKYLRKWAQREGIEPFTFYAARHSFASIARSIGVEKATVDDALGHIGDYRVADIYAERNWHLVAEAQARVLSLFRWR